jgi:phenylacetic acid degradation operon negative regulatory protein
LGGGVWLTPHIERERELALAIREESTAEAKSFIAEMSSLGDPRRLIAEAWDLEAVRDQYVAFIGDFSRVRAATPEDCFRHLTLLVHAWRRFPFLDPDLPARLLTSRWPRERAHALFVSRHEQWQPPARAFFEGLEAGAGLASQAA